MSLSKRLNPSTISERRDVGDCIIVNIHNLWRVT